MKIVVTTGIRYRKLADGDEHITKGIGRSEINAALFLEQLERREYNTEKAKRKTISN